MANKKRIRGTECLQTQKIHRCYESFSFHCFYSEYSSFMFITKIKKLQIKLKHSLTLAKMSDFPGHRQKDFNKKNKNFQNKNTNL